MIKSQYIVILSLEISAKVEKIAKIPIYCDFCVAVMNYIYYICKKSQYVVNMEEIGKDIKHRRLVLKITQQELADLAGVSINTIVAVERGVGNPRIATVLSVCNVLGLQLITKIKG